jgi:hypothetical protein
VPRDIGASNSVTGTVGKHVSLAIGIYSAMVVQVVFRGCSMVTLCRICCFCCLYLLPAAVAVAIVPLILFTVGQVEKAHPRSTKVIHRMAYRSVSL